MIEATVVCPACDVEHVRGSPECPGRRVGTTFHRKYELVAVLGCGGMGAVYEARHVELGRRCAVKVMLASLGSSAAAAARFISEARQVAALDHPGIVRIHDFGRTDDGTLFIEMELLEGDSVEAWAQTGPSTRDAIDVIARALEALGHAHEQHVIHRDLKPDNIFLAKTPRGERRVVLLDFGIARADVPADSRVTSQGALLGTLAYMSPEQFVDAAAADVRSDVFAMAATLFRILAGQPAVHGTRAEIVRQLAAGDYPRSLRALGVGVSAALDRVISDALDPDPRRRPGDASSLRAALLAAGAPSAPAATELEAAAPEPRAVPPRRAPAPTELEEAPVPAPADVSASPGPIAVPASSLATARPRSRAGLAVGAGVVAVVAIGVAVWRLAPRGAAEPAHAAAVRDARTPADAAIDASGPAPDMVRIPGATFVDGFGPRADLLAWCDAIGEPARACTEQYDRVSPHDATVATFDLDRYEVKQADFQRWLDRLVASGAAETVPSKLGAKVRRASDYVYLALRGCLPTAASPEVAAICVTPAGAAAYCQALGKRLPTSDEWSLAAGVAAHRNLPWPASTVSCEDAVYARAEGQRCQASADGPSAVDAPNKDVTPEQVHDLGGNVSEWVDAPPDQERYLARGGSWAGLAIDLHPAKRMWVGVHDGGLDFLGRPTIGFRCARSVR